MAIGVFVPSSRAQQPSAIIAGRYVAPDGQLKDAAVIVLAGGHINSVRPTEEMKAGRGVDRYPGAVVCPGLIDVYSKLGATGSNIETAYAVDPGTSAIDLVDRTHNDFRDALEAGITTVLIAPSPNNLISGAAAVVKTAGLEQRGGSPMQSLPGLVLRDDGPLMFALGSSVLNPNRPPTSRLGSLAVLRDALEGASTGQRHNRVTAFVEGRLDGLVVCETPMDVDAALRTLDVKRQRFALIHTSDAQELADDLRGGVTAVVVGPYGMSTAPRTLATAGVLSAAGVPIAFAGNAPTHPAGGLRLTAALAVRYGMDPAAARRAMTTTAAEVAGVAQRVGAIRAGLDADMVVFSDDPLRLDARVLAVYVAGVRVYDTGAVRPTAQEETR